MSFAHGYFPLPMSTRSEAIVRSVFEVPLNRHLGLRLIDEHDPAQGVELTVGEQHINNVGVMHGGVYPSCLDVAAYLAVVPHLAEGTHATTVSNSTAIARGAKLGDVIQFRGELTKLGRTLVFVTSSATKNGETIATCDLVKAVVPAPELG